MFADMVHQGGLAGASLPTDSEYATAVSQPVCKNLRDWLNVRSVCSVALQVGSLDIFEDPVIAVSYAIEFVFNMLLTGEYFGEEEATFHILIEFVIDPDLF